MYRKKDVFRDRTKYVDIKSQTNRKRQKQIYRKKDIIEINTNMYIDIKRNRQTEILDIQMYRTKDIQEINANIM